MRIAFFNYSDLASGAEALIDDTVTTLLGRGIEARLYVMDRFTERPYVHRLPHAFGERRLEYWFRKATGRNNLLFPSTMFLGFDRWIKEANLWHFHNLHGHFVSIPVLARQSRRRPIVLSPVDQFLATGYCTYTLGCDRFRDHCGECPQLDLPYPGISRDVTANLLTMKRLAMQRSKFNVLVHTKYLADFYASTFVAQCPVEQIYYGVNTRIFRPMEREAVARQFSISPAEHVLTVGLIHSDVDDKRKGLQSLLDPLQRLANRFPGRIRVLAVGRASERIKSAATGNLPVLTLPFLPGKENLAAALNVCDVLLYPTRADNLSLTCLSALACGVPVISSNVGGQSEAVSDNVNGFLCDPDRPEEFIDRIEQMITMGELVKRLSIGARKSATERFDLDVYVDNLIEYYDRITKRQRHA